MLTVNGEYGDMEGLILNEQTKYVTFLRPVFDSIGYDVIRSLNWRVTNAECGGSAFPAYSFANSKDTWISGDKLVEEVKNNPDVQLWWGLLQGFHKSVSEVDQKNESVVDIQNDTEIWKNPVTMRSTKAVIEIEAFDSSMTIVISNNKEILERLKCSFPLSELLSEYNSRLCM